MNEEFIAKRIKQLREEKGVSARKMSLSLDKSESYINRIENKEKLLSMKGLFHICEYFSISPKTFFDNNSSKIIKYEENINYEDFVKKQIMNLRQSKDISAQKLSLSINKNRGYIKEIETSKAFLSITVFFQICEYFSISPKDFFNM